MELIPNGNLPTTSTVNKIEEMPYEGKSVPMGGTSPKTDKQGMKIMGESGAGATGKDING